MVDVDEFAGIAAAVTLRRSGRRSIKKYKHSDR